MPVSLLLVSMSSSSPATLSEPTLVSKSVRKLIVLPKSWFSPLLANCLQTRLRASQRSRRHWSPEAAESVNLSKKSQNSWTRPTKIGPNAKPALVFVDGTSWNLYLHRVHKYSVASFFIKFYYSQFLVSTSSNVLPKNSPVGLKKYDLYSTSEICIWG